MGFVSGHAQLCASLVSAIFLFLVFPITYSQDARTHFDTRDVVPFQDVPFGGRKTSI